MGEIPLGCKVVMMNSQGCGYTGRSLDGRDFPRAKEIRFSLGAWYRRVYLHTLIPSHCNIPAHGQE